MSYYGRYEQNKDQLKYQIKNFKKKCNQPISNMIGTTINDGSIGPCTVDTDSKLKQPLEEPLYLQKPEYIGTYQFYPSFQSRMPQGSPFLYSTSVPFLPQQHAVPQFKFPFGGSTTRNYNRKDFYSMRYKFSQNDLCFYPNNCSLK